MRSAGPAVRSVRKLAGFQAGDDLVVIGMVVGHVVDHLDVVLEPQLAIRAGVWFVVAHDFMTPHPGRTR